MKKLPTILSSLSLAAVLLSAAQSAHAVDKGLYLGASIGESDVSITGSSVNVPAFSGNDFAYKGIIGVRFLDWLAVEGNYVDLGKPDNAQLKADSNGVSAFVVGYKDVGPVDFFAKAGAINWKSKITSNGVRVDSHDGTDLAYGVGVQVGVPLLFKIRAEYERYEVDRGANLLSVGLIWTFL